MGWEAYLVLGMTLGMLGLLISGRGSLDAIGLALIVVLVAVGILDYKTAVAGFGNKAILTIAGLYVVGEGLTRTGAVEFIARAVLHMSGGGTRRILILSCLIAGGISTVLNDTAVVVVFIPILVGLAQTTGAPISVLLMPLAFSALLGGMGTLIGTSTNILVSGVAEANGQPPLGMFEMTPLGLPLLAVGVVYLTFLAPKLLPKRPSLTAMMAGAGKREYVTELVISANSVLTGRKLNEAFVKVRAKVLFCVRGGEMLWPPFDAMVLQAGDVVMVRGGVDELADLERQLGLKMDGGVRFDPKTMTFFELAVAPHSPLVGRRAEELQLFRDYGAVVVAVLRAGHHIRERVSRMVMRPGDLLLVAGSEEAETRLRSSPDFYLLTGAHKHFTLRAHARKALAVAALVVALFTAGSVVDMTWLPQPFVAVLGAMAMIAIGCVTPRRVYRTIDWPILIFIAGTLALGEAMSQTGAGAFIAGQLVQLLSGFGPKVILSGIVLLCVLFNTLIAHSAVAVLFTPIAIRTAQAWAAANGLAPGDPQAEAFLRGSILAIGFGGSLCFATPIGHQVNLMVFGPGGYRYGDFVRLGLPLSLIAWAVISLGLPLLVGLR
ncbi:MAG: SLC13 family permease [Planctomycetota bacterium]|nr:MAG: SLC13 family permease [Planctomycetota bacterium]